MLVKKDGTRIQAEVLMSPHCGEDGNISRIDGIIRDVTDKQKLEGTFRIYSRYIEKISQELYLEQRRFRCLAENSKLRVARISKGMALKYTVAGGRIEEEGTPDPASCYSSLWNQEAPCPWCPVEAVTREGGVVEFRPEVSGTPLCALMPIRDDGGEIKEFLEIAGIPPAESLSGSNDSG